MLGPFFFMWFCSGIVMMYVPFPSIPEKAQFAYMSPVDTDAINISPARAVAECGLATISSLRLITFNTRPTYVCNSTKLGLKVIYADDGTRASPLTRVEAGHLVERFTSEPITVIAESEYDQWTVHQNFDSLRPLYRIEMADQDRTHLYITPKTGELVQRTTRSQRFWNYIGSVPHWIYPTLLRKDWVAWDLVVWWLSLFGSLCAITGVYLGVVHWTRVRRSSRTALSLFRGWMRWHHILGLFVGLVIVSWIVSGWLSMDHGRLFSSPSPTNEVAEVVRGGSYGAMSGRASIADLSTYPPAMEFSFHAFDGVPIIVGKTIKGPFTLSALNPDLVAKVVDKAFSGGLVQRWGFVSPNDIYTQLREGQLPENTIRVELSDPYKTWVHIDGRSGEILSIMDQSRRIYRWLFNGLHSLDVPGLADKRPLWDILMLALLLAGSAASLTSVVLGLKRIMTSR